MAKSEQRRTMKATPAASADAGTQAPPKVETMRLRVGEYASLTQDSVLRDLEAAKHVAFDDDNITAAVRAIELQGRIIGVFREPDPDAIRRVPDEVLVRRIAGDNEVYAQLLHDTLKNGLPKPPPPSPAAAPLRTATGQPIYPPAMTSRVDDRP
jgi:hypothetical protein